MAKIRTISLTDQDMGVLIAFARKEANPPEGALLTRMLTAGVLEYYQEQPKVNEKDVVAYNKKVLAQIVSKAEQYLADLKATCPKNPKVRDFDIDYRTKNSFKEIPKVCSKLRVSKKGWQELESIGVTPQLATSCS